MRGGGAWRGGAITRAEADARATETESRAWAGANWAGASGEAAQGGGNGGGLGRGKRAAWEKRKGAAHLEFKTSNNFQMSLDLKLG